MTLPTQLYRALTIDQRYARIEKSSILYKEIPDQSFEACSVLGNACNYICMYCITIFPCGDNKYNKKCNNNKKEEEG